MVLFNYALKELTAKIVYYGPGLSGKTSNLQYIYEELPIKNKGRMLTLATETDRTLYFDFLPVDAGVVRGIKTRVQLYTVPGQVFYNATRRMVLKGADGVVFVADSQKSMVEANLESFENLRENLKAHDLKVEEMPLVLQFNKRDLKEICTLEEMNDSLNPMNGPFYEAVAKDGIGVEETLQAISGLVLKSVIDRYGGDRTMTPLGTMAPVGSAAKVVASDPARTDPDALVSATAMVGGAEAGKASSGGSPPRGKDPKPKPKAGGAWPPAPKEDKVASKDSNPLDAFESLNIEGILDEALRLDEPEEEPVRPVPNRSKARAKPEPVPGEEDDSMFSGLLDEALGSQETESILDSVLGGGAASSRHTTNPPQDRSDPMREIEVELLGEGLEPVEEEDSRSHLSELIKTRVSIPAERRMTNAPAKAAQKEAATASGPIEVPVTIHIDADAEEQDIEVLLKIRLKRK